MMSREIFRLSRRKLSRADKYLADMMKADGRPVISAHDLFHFIQRMYAEAEDKKLYLRDSTATHDTYRTRKRNLLAANVIQPDRDYYGRFRVLALSDLPADDIVCLVDRFCYVSHLSAMHRWGLTNRLPVTLMSTRPDRKTIMSKLNEILRQDGETPFPMRNVCHPDTVRQRPVQVIETRKAGAFIRDRSGFARVATVGQTFLDTLQQPKLCGCMAYVLDVWQGHAGDYLAEIVKAVDGLASPIVKCRAGYILEECLGFQNDRIDAWKAFRQRGGSRKLDPDRAFTPEHSEAWMISLNVE